MNQLLKLIEDFVEHGHETSVFQLFLVLFILDSTFGIAWRLQRQLSKNIPLLNSGAFIGGAIRNVAYFGSAYFIIASFGDDGLSKTIKVALLIGAIGFPLASIIVNYDLATGHLSPFKKFLPKWIQSVLESEKANKEKK